MQIQELTQEQRKRFREMRICSICGNEISDLQDFQYMKFRVGRSMIYRFFHTKCLFCQKRED